VGHFDRAEVGMPTEIRHEYFLQAGISYQAEARPVNFSIAELGELFATSQLSSEQTLTQCIYLTLSQVQAYPELKHL
jgi:hypothetical protein